MIPQQWTRLIANSLTANAAKWWDLYKNVSLPWPKFRDLLIQYYAGNTTLMRLQAKLYSSKQSEKEPVGIFLQQKYLLALRLRPEAPEADILALLVESLRPSIKIAIRASNLQTFGNLFERATQAEADDFEANSRKETKKNPKKSTTTSVAYQPPAQSSPQS